MFISLVSDGGLGAALIRGDHDPSRLVFEQLVGLQLVIAGAVTLGVLAVAPVFGQPAWVAAVMTSSLCIAVFGTASQIHLERHLMFRELATIDVAQSVAYLAWAIPAAMLGGGVWRWRPQVSLRWLWPPHYPCAWHPLQYHARGSVCRPFRHS